ncbi:MAG TPA: glycine cleavage system aminomethyltransferase GcvT [Gammaproteobacteria bacterium]|nr:glycine cleavage system aminomethyltransferase GcvT [Gammaproteobacteria bacterium]
MGQKTPLHAEHARLGARSVDFGGWDMPVHYGSQIDEHHAVRRNAGMFDVSHMTVVDVDGAGARDYLRRLLANDIGRLGSPGKALYSCMLNPGGGVMDDLIVYWRGNGRYRVVVNAATRDKDLAWMRKQAGHFAVELRERADLAMLALQGPQARARGAGALGGTDRALALGPFEAVELGELFVSRTGYTGEDGWEVILPATLAVEYWRRCLDAGFVPCGLGARDTLRLEAGLNLYGQDMDEETTPLESGLAWTVAWEPAEREFTGRAALEAQKSQGVARKLVGLLLDGRGVLRGHQRVRAAGGDGEITSGSFSPTLGRSIALARVSREAQGGCEVEIRGRWLGARMVKPPFVRNGKACAGVVDVIEKAAAG